MRKLSCCLLFLLYTSFAVIGLDFSFCTKSSDASWAQLEKARVYYEQREYGESLRYALDAVTLRTAEANAAAEILTAASRTQVIKRLSDDLVRSLEKLDERGNVMAVRILREIFIQHDAAFFDNSFKKLIDWVNGYKIYPESLFLQGQIHQAEGEYLLAENFYRNAWQNAGYFDIKEDVYSVLYAWADLARFQGKQSEQERYLMLVLDDDPLCPFKDRGVPQVLVQMRRILKEKNSTNNFFKLYRHDTWFALKAYQDLAQNYFAAGQLERAFDCSLLASSIIITNLNRSLSVREVEWEYTNPTGIFSKIGRHPDIVRWAQDNRIWETFYLFCRILAQSGNIPAAQEFLTTTAPFCDDPTWQSLYIHALFLPEFTSNSQG